MAAITNAYVPQPLSLVRGTGGYYLRLKALAADGATPVSFTGATVVFTAQSGPHTIVRAASGFATDAVADDVALVPIETEDTDKIILSGWWEAEYRKDGLEIVFAGGPFSGVGGTNRIAAA